MVINETCSVCGLPKELCVCTEVEKTDSLIEITVERRKYGKYWAVVSGLDLEDKELKSLVKIIKNKMACGGTVKGKTIEVLLGKGDRSAELIKSLVSQGFKEESIHVSHK